MQAHHVSDCRTTSQLYVLTCDCVHALSLYPHINKNCAVGGSPQLITAANMDRHTFTSSPACEHVLFLPSPVGLQSLLQRPHDVGGHAAYCSCGRGHASQVMRCTRNGNAYMMHASICEAKPLSNEFAHCRVIRPSASITIRMRFWFSLNDRPFCTNACVVICAT